MGFEIFDRCPTLPPQNAPLQMKRRAMLNETAQAMDNDNHGNGDGIEYTLPFPVQNILR